MERQNNLQLELFSPSNDSAQINGRISHNSFLTHIRNYEKAILIIITLVITGIVSFSLGVEKGKTLSSTNVSPKEEGQGTIIKKEEVIEKPQPPEKQSYIIQLASYKTKSFAEKEAESLKKKGFSPLILSKGNYSVLCVGSFPNKEVAQSLLSGLKKRYKDCYIRRL